jgi:hypothetical protein
MLRLLHPVTTAFVKSDYGPSGCLLGTREKLLNKIMAWFEDDGPSVYWLRGLAGTGKTTIARSVADLAEQQGLLGASFFFSRADVKRQDATAVLPTIAYQLARWRPELREPLCSAIVSNTEIAGCTMQEQVTHLFEQALSHATSPVPRALLVVDALDECAKIDNCEGGSLMRLLIGCLRYLPFSVKVFITSRDEPSIRLMFDTLHAHSIHKAALHIDIEKEIVDADIGLYLHHHLSSIPGVSNEPAWPPPSAISELTHRANGLFVYAVTIVKYIRKGSYVKAPSTLLDEVLSMKQVKAQYHYRELDSLYLQVLRKAAEAAGEDPEWLECIRDAAAFVVLAQEPLSWTALSSLTGLSTSALRLLSSLILESSDGKIRPFHASFAEFIVDSERCTDLAYLVDAIHYHQRLAGQCLTLMNERLHYNICDLSDPGTPNDQVTNFDCVLQGAAPPELRYACTHWAMHLSYASPPYDHVLKALSTFCGEHLLHWLEIMSLLRQLPASDRNLAAALRLCKASAIRPFMR